MNYTKKTSFLVNAAALIIVLAGLMQASSIVTQLLMAIFISVVCAQPIRWLMRKKVPQFLAILIVLIGILAIFFVFAEMISTSLSSFSSETSNYEKNLNEIGRSLVEFLDSKGFNISTKEFNDFFDPGKIMSATANLLGQLGGFMGNALTIFVLVLFLLLELDALSLKSKLLLKKGGESFTTLNLIATSIRHYLSIKTLTSFLTGLLIWIGLKILGVQYAIIWALIAFLLNYIPNIGSIIAAIPAVLFALVQLGIGGAIWTVVIYFVVNIAIGNFLEPKVMGSGLGLSTFIVFFALIFWGFIFGAIGMFLSVPLTMVIKIIMEHNPKTKQIALALGTKKEVMKSLNEREKEMELE